jgi:glycosyltransferase involved in cell wall biosynthesis
VFGLIAPFFSKCKFVIREASVVSVIGKFGDGSTFRAKLAKIAFNNTHGIVCQSKDMADDFINIFSVKSENVFIINNPITELFSLKEKSSPNQLVKFITIGRLSKEKGHVRILEGLANLPHQFSYTIIGSGPEEEHIKLKIMELGLENKVKHISFTNKIGEELRNHDFYLQGSYVEGFPNALLESCVAGVPVIAYKAPGGTKEIIEEGINGYLVDDQEDFIAKIEQAVRRNWDPLIISKSVLRKFNKEKIMKDYENLFTHILKS